MFFCFREKGNNCTVEFSTWEAFSNELFTKPLADVIKSLQERQIHCVFGAIDLSIL